MKFHEFQERLQEAHDKKQHEKALRKLDAKIQREIDAYLAHQKELPEAEQVSPRGVAKAIEGISAHNIKRFERQRQVDRFRKQQVQA